MDITLLLEMAADGFGDRVAVGPRSGGLDYATLLDRARRAAQWVQDQEVAHVAMVDQNSEAVPVALFGAAVAGLPFVPVNYRLADDQLRAILPRVAPAVVVVDAAAVGRVSGIDGLDRHHPRRLLDARARRRPPSDAAPWRPRRASPCCCSPAARPASRRRRCCATATSTSYVMSTVEFMGADEDEGALVSVPPYHIAGVSAVLARVYSGRRIVYLPQFDARGVGRPAPATRASPTPWWCRPCSAASSTSSRRRASRPAGAAPPVLRRRAHADRR